MGRDLYVYRTTKPEVLALEAKWQKEIEAYRKAVRSFKRKHPVKDAKGKVLPILETRGSGHRVVGYRFYGREVPEGWKVDKASTLSPKRGTKAGKSIAADMDKCRLRDIRDDLKDFGMLAFFFGSTGDGGFGFLSPGIDFLDGACWVMWSTELKPEAKGGYDPDIWESVPLSVYYAVKETQDEAAS